MGLKIFKKCIRNLLVFCLLLTTPFYALSDSNGLNSYELGVISAIPSAISKKVAKLNIQNDHGFWSEQSLSKKLASEWLIRLHAEQRWGADYQLFWYHEYDVGIQYNIKKWINKWFCLPSKNTLEIFSFGPGFTQYSLIQKSTTDVTKWVWVSRPILEMNINFKWKGWQLANRLRGEYQKYNSSHYKSHGSGRYRIILFTPLKAAHYYINPYISNEFFFRSNTYHKTHPHGLVGGLHENRFRLGLGTNLWEDIFTAQIYWQWRAIKQKPVPHQRRWFNTYQYGVLLNLCF